MGEYPEARAGPMPGGMLHGKEMFVPLRAEDQAAPVRARDADLMQQRVETGSRLAHAGVSRDQPVAGELPRQPFEVLVLHDVVLLGEIRLPLQQHKSPQHTHKGHTSSDLVDAVVLKHIPDAKGGESDGEEKFEEGEHAVR
jgi:hypothetical protein